ncbi:solute carrier family 13 member 2-like [Haemaphysalis longicornis]
MIWMGCYWTAEPISLAATSLMPLVLFPFFGILSTGATASAYFDNVGFVMLGSLILAAAVEATQLHKRLALKSVLVIGTSTRRIVLGLMLVSMFLSMWIPNTAAASIMFPVAMAVIEQMEASAESPDPVLLSPMKTPTASMDALEHAEVAFHRAEDAVRLNQVRKLMLLSVAYASNIGGTGSLIGTPPNLIIQSLYVELFNQDDLTFFAWMLYNVPTMLISTILGWMYMISLMAQARRKQSDEATRERVKADIQRRYTELGPMRNIKASTPAMLASVLLLVIPKDPIGMTQGMGLLSWEEACAKVHWGIVILIGGGLTLAEASKASGLSAILVNYLRALAVMPSYLVVIILCFLASFATQFTSNAAVGAIMLPIVFQMAVALEVHPLYFAIPVAVACSFAFMLPAGTPPNAIVYEIGKLSIMDMAVPGFVMNTMCVAVQIMSINILGPLVFNLHVFPDWARHNTTVAER